MLEPLSTSLEVQSRELFIEGMKKAASCARELAIIRNDKAWMVIANMLNQIYHKGSLIVDAKAMTRQDVLFDLDRRSSGDA